ncbi:MAG: hypothetical protein KKD01_00690 [Proteobacteria bacterium]|nr:hypothetical protein [Pseudomonadota bacterium]MBU1231266.1 hypothetical protein [Pseudomonadota bacterium]MBU1419272.1 hypothetical protein [Pseudomonadota bacterium]MBU1453215.1 hypothetical protein [Pseudomonadota bacterium]
MPGNIDQIHTRFNPAELVFKLTGKQLFRKIRSDKQIDEATMFLHTLRHLLLSISLLLFAAHPAANKAQTLLNW